MAFKRFSIPEVGTVTIYKRRGARSIRLSIAHSGDVRVTMPIWAPYKAGLAFARSKAAWIASKQPAKRLLAPNSRIGKAHRLVFYNDVQRSQVASRLVGDEVRILLPPTVQPPDDAAQEAAHAASKRALKQEAEQLLPQRVRDLARQHGFSYGSVSIRHLQSRWGSCNHKKDIVLNSYLMQLRWELIDYVILHELMHTQILAHGPRFWAELEKYVSNLSAIRKQMRDYRPLLASY